VATARPRRGREPSAPSATRPDAASARHAGEARAPAGSCPRRAAPPHDRGGPSCIADAGELGPQLLALLAATHERGGRSVAGVPPGAAGDGRRQRTRLALGLHRRDLVVLDAADSGTAGARADQHAVHRSRRLQPGGGVDRIADTVDATVVVEPQQHLPGGDADTHVQRQPRPLLTQVFQLLLDRGAARTARSESSS